MCLTLANGWAADVVPVGSFWLTVGPGARGLLFCRQECSAGGGPEDGPEVLAVPDLWKYVYLFVSICVYMCVYLYTCVPMYL